LDRPDFTQRVYPVTDVIEVHDGDTFRLMIDAGFETGHWPWLRLKDFSCPELHQQDGDAARVFTDETLRRYMAKGSLWIVTFRTKNPYIVRTYKDDTRTMSRYIADVWLDNDLRLGDELVKHGLARPGAFMG
jgi:endonuclease YncB( thermonuclease family)